MQHINFDLERKISMFEIFPYVAYTNLSNLIWLQ
jgi:hypothetical protein